jgi:signal transduction histidine kinase
VRHKEELIERLKSDNAVLANSVRYLPILAREVSVRAAARPGGEVLEARLRELLGDVLLFTLLRDAELAPRVRQGMDALAAATSVWPDAQDRVDLDVLRNHARVILERKPLVDDAVDQILATPTAARIHELERTYAEHLLSATDTASTRRTFVFAFALALVGFGAAYTIVRLKRSADELAEASSRLSEANIALRVEQAREKELSMLKGRFVSMVSHEFRTPLSIVLSSMELLEAYADRWRPEKKAEHFTRIKTAIRTMTRMLDDVLLLDRSEAGVMVHCPERMDLLRFCEGLVDDFRVAIQDSHTISFEHDGVPAEVYMDEKLLRHVLTNLLSNAIKYSSEGGAVLLDVRCREGLGHFVVEDHGIGIPPEDVPRLFQSFQRASNVGNIKGTGLGLCIAKQMVDLQSGRIEVNSEVSRGTIVRVTIPLGLRAGRDTPRETTVDEGA